MKAARKKQAHVTAVPTVAASPTIESDGMALKTSTRARFIRIHDYAGSSLSDLLIEALTESMDSLTYGIDQIADELVVLHDAIENENGSNVCTIRAIDSMERRLRVIAEVQRRMDTARADGSVQS